MQGIGRTKQKSRQSRDTNDVSEKSPIPKQFTAFVLYVSIQTSSLARLAAEAFKAEDCVSF